MRTPRPAWLRRLLVSTRWLVSVGLLMGCGQAPHDGPPSARSAESTSAPTPQAAHPAPQARPRPPGGGPQADPNAPPQLNPNDPRPGIGQAIPTHGGGQGPPANALQQTSFQEAAAPQPDPGPAPQAPAPDATGCDPGMVRAQAATGPICVHQYEVSVQLKTARPGMIRQYIHQPELLRLVSAPGQYPSIVSWNEASRLCTHFGYRLCTSAEWQDLCDGVPGDGGHPYAVQGDPETYPPGACVFTHTRQGGMVPLQRTGSAPWCTTPAGVSDLLGNVWEWTDPQLPAKEGRAVTDKRGGAHYSRELATCGQSSVGTHGPDWLGSVGFRCCATPSQ